MSQHDAVPMKSLPLPAVFSWCVFGLKTPEFTSAGQLPAP
jgi:hypothetical protein